MEPRFTFTPIDNSNRQWLAETLMNDSAPTSYKSKEVLAERIKTDEKISGFIVRHGFEGQEEITCGFSLDMEEKTVISDMFTFGPGRGKELFQHILRHYLTLGWTNKFEISENNADMQRFFVSALHGVTKV